MYSGMASVSISYQDLRLSYRHNYVGYRYTSTDNFQYLEPYDLGAIQAAYQTHIATFPARVFFEANNVWNEQYQIMSSRPMPGINFNAGFSIQLYKPNSNN
jgi:hypothetical protein